MYLFYVNSNTIGQCRVGIYFDTDNRTDLIAISD